MIRAEILNRRARQQNDVKWNETERNRMDELILLRSRLQEMVQTVYKPYKKKRYETKQDKRKQKGAGQRKRNKGKVNVKSRSRVKRKERTQDKYLLQNDIKQL